MCYRLKEVYMGYIIQLLTIEALDMIMSNASIVNNCFII